MIDLKLKPICFYLVDRCVTLNLNLADNMYQNGSGNKPVISSHLVPW